MPFDPTPPQPKVGVLLINLGTPDDCKPKAVRRYLAEFLSDPRVIELPKLLWKPILYGAVLTRRPAQASHAYGSIWQGRGSPLAVYTQDQVSDLRVRLGPDILVDYAMRYGNPSIASRMNAMMAEGCEKILLAPLYPQYSAATTATALDKAFEHLASLRSQPAIRTLPPYYADPLYVGALQRSVQQSLSNLSFRADRIIASYHGMPVRTERLGDPYHRQCLETTRLLSAALGQDVMPTFQSRFGSAKWFEPATDQVLAALPAQGIKRVAIITPGFSVDCVETLEEIDIRGRETFLDAGGESFAHLPSLNASAHGMAMLELVVRRELAGWLPSIGRMRLVEAA